MGTSSVLERHFASSSNPEQLRVEMDDPIETPTVDDEKSVGLVGATICFTPKTSPVSSPNRKGSPSGVNAITTEYSLNGDSNNYIGSLHEDSMDHTCMESVVSIMKSSAVQVASSLDGRSITEYEVLDGIHSRGTIECEDLISEDGSGKHPCARSGMNTNVKGNLSGSITCPSLNYGGYDDLTLPTLASPFRDFLTPPSEKSHHVTGGGVGYSRLLTNSNTDDVCEIREDVVENEQVDGGSVNSSSIDDRPLNAFMTLQVFWECRATLSSMTKSMVLRVLGTEKLTDITTTTTTITTDVPKDNEVGMDPNKITVAATSPMSADMMVGKSSEGNAPSDHTLPSFINRFEDEVAFEEDLLETEKVNNNGVDCDCSTSADSCRGIIAKCKHVIGTIISTTATLCFLVLFVYICNIFPSSGNDVLHEEVEEYPQHELIAIPSQEPTFDGDVLDDDAYTFKGSWLAVSTILTLMLGTIIFKPKNSASSPAEDLQHESSPNHVAGIWSDEEHRQFLEGYNIHGRKWKLVSKFVPTRSDTQVRAHGTYWLKVRSPTKMTRARVVAAPTPTNSPDNPMKKESSPSSVSSGKSTPTKSNLSTDAKTPIASNKDRSQHIKGIFRNRLSKHVTPKSEHKPRKVTTKQGPKSEPIKRVRIQAA
jgi:hypothetical protein